MCACCRNQSVLTRDAWGLASVVDRLTSAKRSGTDAQPPMEISVHHPGKRHVAWQPSPSFQQTDQNTSRLSITCFPQNLYSQQRQADPSRVPTDLPTTSPTKQRIVFSSTTNAAKMHLARMRQRHFLTTSTNVLLMLGGFGDG